MKLYKLTDHNGYTTNNTKWEVGTEIQLPVKDNPRLCTHDVIHAYKNIDLGLILNPIHNDFTQPLLYEAEGEICVEDWDKVGCFSLRIIKKLSLPEWYKDKEMKRKVLISFAISCAESVLPIFESEILGNDRPRKAIKAAASGNATAAGFAARSAYAASYLYATHPHFFSVDASNAARAAAYAAGAASNDVSFRNDIYSAAYAAFYAATISYSNVEFTAFVNKAIKTVLEGTNA